MNTNTYNDNGIGIEDGETTTPNTKKYGGLIGGDLLDAVVGGLVGFWEGIYTGMAFGGKFAGAGGLLVGGIAQLVGWIAAPIIVTPLTTIGGFLLGEAYISNLAHLYRTSMGGGAGIANPGAGSDNGLQSNGLGGILSASIDNVTTLLLGTDEGSYSGEYSLNDNQNINSATQELLGLQSAMGSFGSNGINNFDTLNTDTGFAEPTLLLMAATV